MNCFITSIVQLIIIVIFLSIIVIFFADPFPDWGEFLLTPRTIGFQDGRMECSSCVLRLFLVVISCVECLFYSFLKIEMLNGAVPGRKGFHPFFFKVIKEGNQPCCEDCSFWVGKLYLQTNSREHWWMDSFVFWESFFMHLQRKSCI